MKILITGVSGQLGGELYKISEYENYGTYLSNLPKNIGKNMNKVDIAKFDDIFNFIKRIKPDWVIHCAALRNVDLCEENKELAWKSNVIGTENIVGACKKFGVKMVYVSTDYVFDGNNGAYKEEDIPNPVNFYGKTKIIGEWLVRNVEYFLIVRPSMIISNTPGNYVDFTINGLKNGGISGATDIKSSPTLVSELAEAVITAIEKDLSGIYHMAGDEMVSRYDFMRMVAKNFGYDSDLVKPTTSVELKFKAKRPKDTSLDITKSKKMKIKFSALNESLKKIKFN